MGTRSSLSCLRVYCGMRQYLLQGIEPGLEIPPLIDAFLENWAAHLLRARGSYAALGFVELHALGFEFKSAKIQYPAHVRLEIVDHGFMLDAQYPSGQDRVPVRHQFHIGSV